MITQENSARLCRLSEKLSHTSNLRYTNTFTEIDWPDSVAADCWYTSEELITLYHTDFWDALSPEQKQLLSFYEAVNFYSINIHGERALVQGVTNCLYRGWPNEVCTYLHHFVEEENRHMNMFGNFVNRYAGGGYAEKKLPFQPNAKRSKGIKEFILFAEIVIFEEIVDIFNSRMGEDERLHPIARRINYIHHYEETRHLGFGRAMVKQLFETYRQHWTDEDFEEVGNHLVGYMRLTWKQYYNPKVYADVGIEDAVNVANIAWEDPRSIAWRNDLISRVVKYFSDIDVFNNIDVSI